MTSQAQMRRARNNEMKKLRAKGWTLQKIGWRFNLTRERVRQILL